MKVKPFTGLVPSKGNAERIASVPYDVVNTEEARALAAGNPDSFLHIVRAEIDFPQGTNPYSEEIYQKSKSNLQNLCEKGMLVRESGPSIYLYRQIMDGHSQTGITLVCHIDDYGNDLIKKHEKTRPDKENDRTKLTDVLSANTGPVFLTYENNEEIDTFVADHTASAEPTIDFTDDAGVQHTVWQVAEADAGPILNNLEKIPVSYVADGHHRSASAHRVGSERRAANPNHDGTEGYNWFLAVMFPANQLKVLAYNRVVKDLNGLSADDFLEKLKAVVEVNSDGKKIPDGPESVCMYLDGKWHTLSWKVEADNPIDLLDVSVLQDKILTPLLGVGDPRTDKRIDFVGGIRGTAELEKRVNSGDWEVAFSMHPTTVQQLMDIADAGEIMPPKSTWFEPKLRSGLFVYTLED
ncbi:MAG: DUF1015 family protein [Verrucomicrobiales bacterium]|nr:DUF1015 family protein [Verrucomicrobiales bacterium]